MGGVKDEDGIQHIRQICVLRYCPSTPIPSYLIAPGQVHCLRVLSVDLIVVCNSIIVWRMIH